MPSQRRNLHNHTGRDLVFAKPKVREGNDPTARVPTDSLGPVDNNHTVHLDLADGQEMNGAAISADYGGKHVVQRQRVATVGRKWDRILSHPSIFFEGLEELDVTGSDNGSSGKKTFVNDTGHRLNYLKLMLRSDDTNSNNTDVLNAGEVAAGATVEISFDSINFKANGIAYEATFDGSDVAQRQRVMAADTSFDQFMNGNDTFTIRSVKKISSRARGTSQSP